MTIGWCKKIRRATFATTAVSIWTVTFIAVFAENSKYFILFILSKFIVLQNEFQILLFIFYPENKTNKTPYCSSIYFCSLLQNFRENAFVTLCYTFNLDFGGTSMGIFLAIVSNHTRSVNQQGVFLTPRFLKLVIQQSNKEDKVCLDIIVYNKIIFVLKITLLKKIIISINNEHCFCFRQIKNYTHFSIVIF